MLGRQPVAPGSCPFVQNIFGHFAFAGAIPFGIKQTDGEDELAARIGCERLRLWSRPIVHDRIPETYRGGRPVGEQQVERYDDGHYALGVTITPETMNRVWRDDDTVSLRALQHVRCRHQCSGVERPGRHSRRCRAYVQNRGQNFRPPEARLIFVGDVRIRAELATPSARRYSRPEAALAASSAVFSWSRDLRPGCV